MVPSFSGTVTHETNGEPRNRQVPPEKPTALLALDDSAVGAWATVRSGARPGHSVQHHQPGNRHHAEALHCLVATSTGAGGHGFGWLRSDQPAVAVHEGELGP